MTRWAQEQPEVAERVWAELRALRAKVPGINGSLVATNEGMLVAHDFPGADATRLAALVSTTLGLARQTVRETGRGEFREAVALGSDGYLMVCAAGGTANVAIAAGEQAQAGILQHEARQAIARIARYAAEFPAWSAISDYASAGTSELPYRQAE
jgi:hypothetical protein